MKKIDVSKKENKEYLYKIFKRIKKDFAKNFNDLLKKDYNDKFDLFKKLTFYMAWVIPSKKLINEMVQFIGDDHVLEIGSGSGLWVYLLRLKGVTITPSEISKYFKYKNSLNLKIDDRILKFPKTFVPKKDYILKVSSNDLKLTNVLMFMWPLRGDKSNYSDIYLKKFKGDKVIYVGEEPWDYETSFPRATGSRNFFRELKKNWKLQKVVEYEKDLSLKDKMYLYVRKN